MSRRVLWLAIGLTLPLLAVPLDADAQSAQKVPHIGLLSADPKHPFPGMVLEALRELGYVEGRNLTLTSRFSGGDLTRYPGYAVELVGLNVDLIVALTPGGAKAAKAATTTVPVVFNTADAQREGLVKERARPGGNLTGFSGVEDGVTAKQLAILKEMVPGARRVALLMTPDPMHERYVPETMEGAKKLELELLVLRVRTAEEIERALKTASEARVDAMHIYGHRVFRVNFPQLVALTKSQRLPTIYYFPDYVEAGGLMSYGPDTSDFPRRIAGYVDRILKGARPGDLPLQYPSKWNLVINLRTAREIGLTVPPALLARATRVIE